MADSPASASSAAPSATPTDAQIDAMEAQVAARRAEQASAAAAARVEKLKPLTDMFASDAWTQIMTTIAAAKSSMVDETFYMSIRNLGDVMGLLPQLVTMAPAPASANT